MTKDNTNSVQNDTSDNQDDWNDFKILETGGIRHSGKIGKLKDDNSYVVGNKGGSFQDRLLKNILIMKKEWRT